MAETQTPTAEAQRPGNYEVPEWLSLDEDETIEWMGEPVMASLAGTVVAGVVLLVVLVGVFLLLLVPFQYLSIKNTDFVVTNKALYVKTGALSTNIESVGLDKIQNTEFSQSFWGKQFDFGKIEISTAGSSGAEIAFNNIENAREVRELITRLGNEYTSGSRGPAGEGTGTETAPRGDRMDELIAELRATREAMESVEAAIRETSGGRGGTGRGTVDESTVEWDESRDR